MKPIDSQTTLTISESCDLPTQQHYTKKKVSCCDCFHRKCPFRLWQILVFLLVIAFVIAVMGLLIAMFGPGNANLKYSKSESKAYNPTETIQGGNLIISLLRNMVKAGESRVYGTATLQNYYKYNIVSLLSAVRHYVSRTEKKGK